MVIDHFGILVFTDNQMAVRTHGEIVAVVELVFALALEKQFDLVGFAASAGDKSQDLAELSLATIR